VNHKNLECRKEREQQNKEKHEYEFECDLCEEKFKVENELVNHWKIDHVVHIYECIHLGCRIKYICQDMWKEHMKDKHGIGFLCEKCNECCMSEEKLEEHMEDEEDIEHDGFECVECNENFESVDKIIEHEHDSECDQCKSWLGCRTRMIEHKKREHESRIKNRIP